MSRAHASICTGRAGLAAQHGAQRADAAARQPEARQSTADPGAGSDDRGAGERRHAGVQTADHRMRDWIARRIRRRARVARASRKPCRAATRHWSKASASVSGSVSRRRLRRQRSVLEERGATLSYRSQAAGAVVRSQVERERFSDAADRAHEEAAARTGRRGGDPAVGRPAAAARAVTRALRRLALRLLAQRLAQSASSWCSSPVISMKSISNCSCAAPFAVPAPSAGVSLSISRNSTLLTCSFSVSTNAIAVLPRQPEARREHARGELRADLRRFERIAHVADRRLALVRSLQLQILIDREAQRRVAERQPCGHRRRRRALGFEQRAPASCPKCRATFRPALRRAPRRRHRRPASRARDRSTRG